MSIYTLNKISEEYFVLGNFNKYCNSYDLLLHIYDSVLFIKLDVKWKPVLYQRFLIKKMTNIMPGSSGGHTKTMPVASYVVLKSNLKKLKLPLVGIA